MSLAPIYTPGSRETKWSKVPCLREHRDGRGLNPGPPDPEFEVFTIRPHTPPQFTKYASRKTKNNFEHMKTLITFGSSNLKCKEQRSCEIFHFRENFWLKMPCWLCCETWKQDIVTSSCPSSRVMHRVIWVLQLIDSMNPLMNAFCH